MLTRPTFTSLRSLRRGTVAAMLGLGLIAIPASEARAHCDSMDGPVVLAARNALETGRIAGVLAWVRAADEAEVRDAFARTRAVRLRGADARDLADRWFFETVVRLHRAGEDEPYTGLRPAGAGHTPAIREADRALASGSLSALDAMLTGAVREALHARFEKAVAARAAAPDDVAAGRAYVAAYVALLHYAEEVEHLTQHEDR